MTTTKSILSKLKKLKSTLLAQYSVEQIGIFGSYAKNNYNENSDIDIVYKLKNRRLGYKECLNLENILKNQFEKEIDLINIDIMNPLIKRKVIKDIIYV